MGQDQDVTLITSVTWPREGLTTTGGVPAGVEVRPIWTTSTTCVRELALKISGSRERGTLFTILLELDLSLFRKPCLSALIISCQCCKSCLFPAGYVIYIQNIFSFVKTYKRNKYMCICFVSWLFAEWQQQNSSGMISKVLY